MTRRTRRKSISGRVARMVDDASASQPLLSRTGPAWVFGIMGVAAEAFVAPMVLLITLILGAVSYLLLDTPNSRIRAQHRPRFVSVRILYLNTMIIAGFWLAVMFTFSAADPSLTNRVDQRLPTLIGAATNTDLRHLIAKKSPASAHQSLDASVLAADWFDVFLHGIASGVSLNFMLYGVVIAHRRRRSKEPVTRTSRKSLRYDSLLGLFVDEDSALPR